MKTNCIRRCVQTFDWCIVLHLRVIFPSHLLFDHQLVALDNELQFVPFGSQRGQGVQAAAGHRSQQAVLLLSAREVGQDLHSDAQHGGRACSTDRLKLRTFRLGRSLSGARLTSDLRDTMWLHLALAAPISSMLSGRADSVSVDSVTKVSIA